MHDLPTPKIELWNTCVPDDDVLEKVIIRTHGDFQFLILINWITHKSNSNAILNDQFWFYN